ncbi:unnamed protein product [Cuscuta campestris]|uniref:Uncharacterized protein n=1 Tax=Cuscuta campestris TaxID=132261 RepID=A0A484NFM0_9ASTE|nr:unnamed protein product [Cuscuta campestris]
MKGLKEYNPKSALLSLINSMLTGFSDSCNACSSSHPIGFSFLPSARVLDLLLTNGKLVLVGLPEKPLDLLAFPLIMGIKLVAGSGIAGIN